MWLHSFPFSFFLKECFIHFFLCVWSDSIHFNWMYGKFFFLPVALFYNNSIYLSIFLVSNFESYVNHYGKPEIKSSNSKHEMRSFHDPYTIYIYLVIYTIRYHVINVLFDMLEYMNILYWSDPVSIYHVDRSIVRKKN